MQKLNANFGYTLDGGEAGSLEDETFSADSASIIVHGVIVHPGYAKGILINALKIAGEILDSLPKEEWSPETTEKREGFVHPVRVEGISERAQIDFIVRDFTTEGLKSHHKRLEAIARKVIEKYPGTSVEYVTAEQYRNMKEVLDQNPQVVANAQEAIRRAGLQVKTESIRGGTDGSRLSFMGLPCPNVFTGMQGIHSKLEWIGVNDMVKAAETVIQIASIWEEKS
jgi:tripeptide aminopeptidase